MVIKMNPLKTRENTLNVKKLSLRLKITVKYKTLNGFYFENAIKIV